MDNTYKIVATDMDLILLHTEEGDPIRRQCRGDWVIVLPEDEDFDALKNNECVEVKPLDETDFLMAEAGYTRYGFQDLDVLDEELPEGSGCCWLCHEEGLQPGHSMCVSCPEGYEPGHLGPGGWTAVRKY